MVAYLTIVFELMCLLTSLVLNFKRSQVLYLKLFPVFLIITIAFEITMTIVQLSHRVNVRFYNFFSTFELVFYFYVLLHIVQNNQVRKIIVYSIFVYPLIAIVNILRLGTHTFHSLTYVVGVILVVGFCMYYFYELFKKPVQDNPVRQPFFWISLGLIFYYGCTTPILVGYNFLLPTEGLMFTLILNISNYFLYTAFSISFMLNFKMQNA